MMIWWQEYAASSSTLINIYWAPSMYKSYSEIGIWKIFRLNAHEDLKMTVSERMIKLRPGADLEHLGSIFIQSDQRNNKTSGL